MTMLTRRTVLGALGACGLTPLMPRLALASAPTDRRFVLVILRGGMDGLAAVAPVGDPAYSSVRGPLALDAGTGARLDGTFVLNPALGALAPLNASGEMAVVHATGLAFKSRSHFDAQNVLEAGGLRARQHDDGWLNRALAAFPSTGEAKGLAVAPTVPLVLMGAEPVTSWAPSVIPAADDDFLMRVARLYEADPALEAALASAMGIRDTAGAGAMGGEGQTRARNQGLKPFATGLGNLLASESGPRIAVTELGGFDSHARQGTTSGPLANTFAQLADGLIALKASLGPVWDRTVVLVATEFGRTVKPNGSLGTDHGTASAAFVLGGRIAGGRVYGDWPGLGGGALFEGRDLVATSDVVGLFKGVLEAHLGVSKRHIDGAVFPESIGVAPFLAPFTV